MPAFGGGVGQGGLGGRTAGGGRGHGDDGAVVALSHPGQEGLDGQEGGGEVGVDRSSPVGLGDVFERPGPDRASARVGDQDVHGTETLLDRVSHGFDLVVAGEVGDRSEGMTAGFLDVGDHGPHRIGVAAMDDDGGPSLGEEPGDGGADAARASGHQRDTAVQLGHRPFLSAFVSAVLSAASVGPGMGGEPWVPAMKLMWTAANRSAASCRVRTR